MTKRRKRVWGLIVAIIVVILVVYGFVMQRCYKKIDSYVNTYSMGKSSEVIHCQEGIHHKAIIVPEDSNEIVDESVQEENFNKDQSPTRQKLQKLVPPVHFTVITYQEYPREDNINEVTRKAWKFKLYKPDTDKYENYSSATLGYYDRGQNLPASAKDLLAIDLDNDEDLYRLRYAIRDQLKKEGKQNSESGIYPIRLFLHSDQFPLTLIKRDPETKQYTLYLADEYAPNGEHVEIQTDLLIPFIKDQYLTDDQKAQKEDLSNQINQGIEDQKKISLTFDDGPSEFTDTALNVYNKYDCNATFFIEGQHIDDHKETVQRMHDEGFEIGNHSWDHPALDLLPKEEVEEQVTRTNDKIEEVTGEKPTYIRPPYGRWDDKVRDVVNENGMHLALWTSEQPEDWNYLDEEHDIQFIKDDAAPNAVIQMHDVHGSTVESLDDILQYLTDNGYDVVCFSEIPYTDQLGNK